MATTLVRTQVLLEKEQQRRLAEIAKSQGKSLSALLRDIVDDLLEAQEREARWERASVALDELTTLRAQIEETHGVYHGNPVLEVRAEREAQLDEVLAAGQKLCQTG